MATFQDATKTLVLITGILPLSNIVQAPALTDGSAAVIKISAPTAEKEKRMELITSQKKENMQWQMLDSKNFTCNKEGYEVRVKLITDHAPRWAILKDGVVVDVCFNHSPTDSELSAKVQAERALNKILESK